MARALWILTLILLASCVSNDNPIEELSTLEGYLVAAPVLERGGDRLILYLSDGQTIQKAITSNPKEEEILKRLAELLLGYQPPLHLFGYPTGGRQWEEYVAGIDFVFCFVSYTDPVTTTPTIVDTCYGNRWNDHILEMIKENGFAGAKKLPKLVAP